MGNVYVSLHETSQPKLSTLKGHTPYNAAALTESVMKEMVKKVRERVPGAADLDEDGTLAQLNAEVEDALLVYLKKLTAPPTTLMISGSGIFSSSDLVLEMTCPPHTLSGSKLRLHVDWKAIKARVKGSGKIAATEKSIGIKALTVLSHKDIGPLVRAKLSGSARDAYEELVIPVLVEITDTSTLKLLVASCGATPLLQQKLKDSTDFARLTNEVAAAAEEIYAEAAKRPVTASALQKELELSVQELILEAADRATAEIQKSAKIRLDRKKYLIRSAVKLTLNVTGTGLGVASLAVSGISGGVSGIYSLLKVVQSIANTALQIRDLARSAEGASAAYLAAFKDTQNLYEGARSRGLVGTAEVAMETASMLFLTENALPSIATCGRLLEQWGGKVFGLVVKAEDMSGSLEAALKAAADARARLQAGLKESEKSAPSAKLTSKVQALVKRVEELEKRVQTTITDVQKLHVRSSGGLQAYERESRTYEDFKTLKKPAWADITSAMLSLAAGATSIATGAAGIASALDKVSLGNDLVTLAEEAASTANDVRELVREASKKS